METIVSNWSGILLAVIGGAAVGALAFRLYAASAKEMDRLKSELKTAREELKRYRTDVNQHFDTASELVNDLTQNYVKVYQHLAEGAQTLGNGKSFNNLLEQKPGKLSIAVKGKRESIVEICAESQVEQVATPVETDHLGDEHAEPYADVAGGKIDPALPEIATKTESSDTTDEDAEPVGKFEVCDSNDATTIDETPVSKQKMSPKKTVDEEAHSTTT